MIFIRGKTMLDCLIQAVKAGRGTPDLSLRSSGRWTFGYYLTK